MIVEFVMRGDKRYLFEYDFSIKFSVSILIYLSVNFFDYFFINFIEYRMLVIMISVQKPKNHVFV